MFKLRIFSFLFFITLCQVIAGAAANPLLDSASAAYAKAEYTKAAKFYETILAGGQEAPDVYFNLGNAYYKSNNIAHAILNYERAVKLNPDNADYNFNLKLANQRIEDKIDEAPQLFLTEWKNGIASLLSEKGWSQLFIVLIILSLTLFALFTAASNRGLKQLGFFGGSVLIVLSIATFFMAKNKYFLTVNGTEAVITAPSITVTGSPNEKGTKLFIIHEGTKVNITRDATDWVEIKIANGNTGWIKRSQLERI